MDLELTPQAFSFNTGNAELFKALLAAQKELKPAIRDSENPHFKSTYANLTACFEAGMPGLHKHGLVLIQVPTAIDNKVSVTTILGHESGQYLSSTLNMQARDAGPQAIGSAITYGKRYSFNAITGLSDEEDDDGNGASKPATQAPYRNTYDDRGSQTQQVTSGTNVPRPSPSTVITAAQVVRLHTIAKKSGWDEPTFKGFVLEKFNKTSSKLLTKAEADILEAALANPEMKPKTDFPIPF